MEREFFLQAVGANDNRNIQGILNIEAPKYFLFEAIYRQVGASLFSECVTTGTSQCGAFTALPAGYRVLLPSGFGRPQYRVAATYKIHNNDNRQIVVSLDRNSNFFALTGRDFDERIIAVTFLWRYKK